MTVEQLGGLLTGLVIVVSYFNNMKQGKKLINSSTSLLTEMNNRDSAKEERTVSQNVRIFNLEAQVKYINSVRRQDLEERLEITNDEEERRSILEQLKTIADFS